MTLLDISWGKQVGEAAQTRQHTLLMSSSPHFIMLMRRALNYEIDRLLFFHNSICCAFPLLILLLLMHLVLFLSGFRISSLHFLTAIHLQYDTLCVLMPYLSRYDSYVTSDLYYLHCMIMTFCTNTGKVKSKDLCILVQLVQLNPLFVS